MTLTNEQLEIFARDNCPCFHGLMAREILELRKENILLKERVSNQLRALGLLLAQSVEDWYHSG